MFTGLLFADVGTYGPMENCYVVYGLRSACGVCGRCALGRPSRLRSSQELELQESAHAAGSRLWLMWNVHHRTTGTGPVSLPRAGRACGEWLRSGQCGHILHRVSGKCQIAPGAWKCVLGGLEV